MLSAKGTVISSSGWQKVKFEFTAECSTDSRWLKKARSYAAKSELEDGRTVSRSSKKAADLKNDGKPGVCHAALSLGALEGDFQVRKFSLTAVD